MTSSVSVAEAEWSRDDVALLVAARRHDRERGIHGFPMAEATDIANRYKFHGPEKPTTDWAEKARKDAQDSYYKRYDSPDNPVNRNGHMWGVTLESGTGDLV